MDTLHTAGSRLSSQYTCRSAVLFIVFNRPDVTAMVFEGLRAARPPRLYIAADGPRASRPGEEALCEQTRRVAEKVDWPCEIKTLFQPRNLGCKEGVVAALNWFFANEEEGIILEDDCQPSADFFRFCDSLLEHYRHDTRVRLISGTNLQHGQKRGTASYYFSRLSHIWGWATWRRTWKSYDKNLAQFTAEEIEHAVRDCYPEPLIAVKWKEIAVALQGNRIDTWDYQLAIGGLLSGSMSAIPNVNLISNIGFGPDATHTVDTASNNAKLEIDALETTILHPKHFVPIQAADLYTLLKDFDIDNLKRQTFQAEKRANRLRHRIKRWLGHHGGPKKWQTSGTSENRR